MRNIIIIVSALFLITLSTPVFSGEDHSGHGAASPGSTQAMPTGTFSHNAVVDGIRTEFQIMSLKDMNIKDPNGATHHVILRLFHDKMNHKIKNIVGKVKVVSPSGKEQTAPLKDYNGIYAANFSFTDKGEYGVICLFKEEGKKHLVKFWYPHG